MTGTPVASILVGRDRRSLGKTLLGCGGLGLVSFVGVSIVRRLEPEVGPRLGELFYPLLLMNDRPVAAFAVVVGWVTLAGLVGYRQGSLLASWAVLFGPLFGGLANVFVARNLCCTGATTTPTVLRSTYSLYSYGMNGLLAAITALVIALVLGTTGYVVSRATNLLRPTKEADADRD